MTTALSRASERVEEERELLQLMTDGTWSADAVSNQRRNLAAAIDREFGLWSRK